MEEIDLAAVEERIDTALQHDSTASCVVLIAGMSRGQILAAFGVTEDQTPQNYLELAGEHPWVAIFEFPGGYVTVEDNGIEGVRPEVLRLLSAGGKAACVFQGAFGSGTLQLFEHGEEVLHHFLEDGNLESRRPDLAPLFGGLSFSRFEEADNYEDEDLEEEGEDYLSAFVVAERFAGIRIEGTAPAEEDYLAYRVTPIPRS